LRLLPDLSLFCEISVVNESDRGKDETHMDTTLRRTTTLLVCVLFAGGLALAVALVAARGASAAAPEPVNVHFTIRGECGFPVRVEVTGKGKFIELPNGRFIGFSPGQRATLTNREEPSHQATYVITGAVHGKELPSGKLSLVYTGRNLLFGPSEGGVVITMGRFTQVYDPQTDEVTPLRGKGRVIDVCQRLA
jgi:hypothetical protein